MLLLVDGVSGTSKIYSRILRLFENIKLNCKNLKFILAIQ